MQRVHRPLLTRLILTRFLAITTSPPEGAFKRGAERRAQGDPEADVM